MAPLYPRIMAADDRELHRRAPAPGGGPAETVGSWLAGQGHPARAGRALLSSGKVWIDATPVTDPGRPAAEGLRLYPDRPRFDPAKEVAVVERTARWCVVHKPSGFLSVPAPGRREPSVVRACERWFGAAFAVHRIDEGTSGLLLVALDEPTQVRLKALFEVHDLERRYLALVRGTFPAGAHTVRSELVRDRGDGKRGSAAPGTPDAKVAVTHFDRVGLFAGGSLVQATLETGRTHQVRIHLAESGHPILGDDLYGGGRGGRLALHATVLGFRDPWTGRSHRWQAPLPDDLDRRVRGADTLRR